MRIRTQDIHPQIRLKVTSAEEVVIAERVGQLDPQWLAVHSVGVLIGRALLIAGEVPWSFDNKGIG